MQPYLRGAGSIHVLPDQAGTVVPRDTYLEWGVQQNASAAVLFIDHLVDDVADRLGGPGYKLQACMVKCAQGAVRQYQATVDSSPQAGWHYALQTALSLNDCKGFVDGLVAEEARVRAAASPPEVRLKIANRAQQFEQRSTRVFRFLRQAVKVGNSVR